MAQASYQTETRILNEIACDPRCRLWWTNHAREQMAERKILAADVKEALMNGHVQIIERKADDVWRVIGHDIDGNRIGVACVVFEDLIAIRIVTAF